MVQTLRHPEENNKPDYFYWKPRFPLRMTSRERQWVGKMVTVKCWQVIFEQMLMEKDQYGEPVHRVRYMGYVQEINKYVPGEELR